MYLNHLKGVEVGRGWGSVCGGIIFDSGVMILSHNNCSSYYATCIYLSNESKSKILCNFALVNMGYPSHTILHI